MPIGDRKIQSWICCETWATEFAKLTTLENMLLGMVRWVWPCRRSGSAIWTDPSEGLSAPRRLLEDFWNVQFCFMIVCQADDPHMDSFSDKLSVVLISYFEVGDTGIKVVALFTLDVNSTGYMTIMFFQCIL